MAQMTVKVKTRWWLGPVVAILIAVGRVTKWVPSDRFKKGLAVRAAYVETVK